jgi:hypothetical protein
MYVETWVEMVIQFKALIQILMMIQLEVIWKMDQLILPICSLIFLKPVMILLEIVLPI